jgi:hypothetical protein
MIFDHEGRVPIARRCLLERLIVLTSPQSVVDDGLAAFNTAQQDIPRNLASYATNLPLGCILLGRWPFWEK